MSIEKYKDEFLCTIKTYKNLSEKSLIAYNSDLNDFFSYYKENKKLFFSSNVINNYFVNLQLKRKLKDTTISRKLITIKMYYQFLYENHGIRNPFIKFKFKFKKEKALPRTISVNEVKKILNTLYESIDESTSFLKFQSYRNLALIDLLITSGIRIGEANVIKLSDIDFSSNIILIHGKGRKQRLIYISSEETINNLKKYIEIRDSRNVDNDYLFVNKQGNQITINSIDNIYRKYKKKAKISKNSTPHSLRHTFATNLLANGADIRSVQEILGHANVSITERYTEVTTKRKVEVLDKYNYRNGL